MGVGVLEKGQQPPPYHQLRGMEGRCKLPQRDSGRSPDHPKVFHYFQHSALRMTSPDTIIIVNYHAATGGRTIVPLVYAPAVEM